MSLRVERVDVTNWLEIAELTVAKHQVNFIESNALSILESQYISGWYPVGLYSDDMLVGFAMYGCREVDSIWIDRFMIDLKYQGQGFGQKFLVYLMEHIRESFKVKKIILSVTPENLKARKFYEDNGFFNTDEVDPKGELIFMYDCMEV
ncbi:GNAT family N-acetyltransferase [Listeria grandensis]|uniref:GNAT family N-acetyltransferase n=1 Tax=Listeria grandensis TaxID=1494963 RepID=UPI001626C2F4|nr:GNAT family N-acetyltransferase [Listeria grandensis]MBC1474659.1 GNAT family N-acetyltransferase [Listeria grandensis]